MKIQTAFFSLFLALSIPAFVHGSDGTRDALLPRSTVFEGRWVKQRATEESKGRATATAASGSGSGSSTATKSDSHQNQAQGQSEDQGQEQGQGQSQGLAQGQGQDEDQGQSQAQDQGQDMSHSSSAPTTQAGAHTNEIHTAGEEAKVACEGLLKSYTPTELQLNGTFAQYWEQGSNPSFELLTSVYPKDVLPKRPNLNALLLALAPDYDVTGDSGYGASDSPVANNGPMGGLPAFCRFGSFIKTSETTQVLAEVWLPLAYNPSIQLAAINQSDFPTNSTPVRLDKDGNYIKKPLWVTKALDKKADPQEATTLTERHVSESSSSDTESHKDKHENQEQTGKKSVSKQDQEPLDFNHLDDATPFDEHFLMGATDPQDSQGSSAQKREQARSKPHKQHHDGDGNTHKHHNGDHNGDHHHSYSGPLDGFDLLGLKGSNDGWNGRLLYVANGGFRGKYASLVWKCFETDQKRC